MAEPNVDFRMSGDEKLLVRALTRSEKEVDKLKRKLGEVGRAGKQAGGAISKGFSTNPLKSFATALMGTGGVYMALRAITAELKQVFELQEKAATAQITLSGARSTLLRNLPMATRAEKAEMITSAGVIARETLVPEKYITIALAEAVSASMGKLEASKRAVRRAAMMYPDQPEAIRGMAGAYLDLSKVTGTIVASVNQGLMNYIAGMSRVVNPQQQLMNIPKAMIGQVLQGSTVAGAAALFSTLTTQIADPTGRITGTAAINLARQLREYKEGEKAFVKVRPSRRLTGETTGERLAELWADPKKAQTFMEIASFETKAIGAIRQLVLDPTSAIVQEYKAGVKALPDEAALTKLADDMIAGLYIDPLAGIAKLKRSFDSATDEILTTDIISATGEVSRKGLIGVLKATGQGAMAERMVRARYELATDLGKTGAIDVAQNILTERAKYLERPYDIKWGHYGEGAGYDVSREVPRAPTERETEMAEMLHRQVEVLEGIQDILARQELTTAKPTTLAHPDQEPP